MVSFVYFDVDRVLTLGFDWNTLEDEIGIPTRFRQEFERFWGEREYELDIGLDADSLIPEIESRFKAVFPDGYSITLDGFVHKFTANKRMWPLVKSLHGKYPMGLLTNMYPRMLDAMGRKGILPDVVWDTVIDSSVEKVQKPDYRIFELAEKRSGYKGEDILFIDNDFINTDAAAEFGWDTFLYDPADIEKSSEKLATIL